MNIYGRHTWIALLCIYIAAVAYLCFMHPDKMPEISLDLWCIPIDKIMHFIMFFPFPVLAYAAFRPAGKKRMIHLAVLAIILVTGTGVALVTEHIQGLIGYRGNDIKDFYADMLGMSCSAILAFIYILIKPKN